MVMKRNATKSREQNSWNEYNLNTGVIESNGFGYIKDQMWRSLDYGFQEGG